MNQHFLIMILIFFLGNSLFGHHGIASTGVSGLDGPGAPLETSSSATLPEGSLLYYTKLDSVKWKRYNFYQLRIPNPLEILIPTLAEENPYQFPDQKDSHDFWMFGFGYGIKSWLSLYTFVPYYVKKEIKSRFDTDPSQGQYTFTNAGFSDVSFMAVFGFKYDNGFKLVPKKESLDDLIDWHFTMYGGFSLPTGNPNIFDRARNSFGEFAPDLATGFGKPSLSFGFTATKQLADYPEFTFLFDTNYFRFFPYRYKYYNFQDKGSLEILNLEESLWNYKILQQDLSKKNYKFGDEFRFNLAMTYSVYKNPDKNFRADLLLEANYQHNQRDKENGNRLEASGGSMVYGVIGTRLYYNALSIGIGYKKPVWKNLNEENVQQGGEGKELQRIIITISTIF
jgi:hypothetical protein